MSSTTVSFLVAFVLGAGLGLFFFGGLWLTVRSLPGTRHPLLLTYGSFAARAGGCMLGFFLITAGRWERLTVGLLGFVLMRSVVMHSIRQPVSDPVRRGAT